MQPKSIKNFIENLLPFIFTILSCSPEETALITKIPPATTPVASVVSLGWSPSAFNFGSTFVGTTTTSQIFQLYNLGNTTAEDCSAPVLTGTDSGDFVIQADSCKTRNISIAGYCSIRIAASPKSEGTKSVTLIRSCLVGGDATTQADQITVKANSVPTLLSWIPSVWSYPPTQVGTMSSSQLFQVHNLGNTMAQDCSVPVLSGDHPGDFVVQADSCKTQNIGVHGYCSIRIAASPKFEGVRSMTLSRTCLVGGTATTESNQITVIGTSGI